MNLERLYPDLEPQFQCIARGFKELFNDRALEVDDVVQEGMALAVVLLRKYPDISTSEMLALCVKGFVRTCKLERRKQLTKSREGRVAEVHDEVLLEMQPDNEAAAQVFIRVFVSEIAELISRFDSHVLREVLLAEKSAPFAKPRASKVRVLPSHIAQALGVREHAVKKSIKRIQCAVAQEYYGGHYANG